MMSKYLTWPVWLSVLLVLLSSASSFTPLAAAQSDTRPRLIVTVDALNVRAGPSTGYSITSRLGQDDEVEIIGRHITSGWWQVLLPDGRNGWVSGAEAYVQVRGDLSSLSESGPADTIARPDPIQNSLSGTLVFQTVNGGPFYAINANGGDLRYLTSGLDPVLSPDGRQVAFTRWETNQHGALGNLWLINIDGSGERVIMDNVRQPRSPAWSPDGTQLTISIQHGGWIDPREDICSWGKPPSGAIEITSTTVKGKGTKFCYTLPPDPYYGLRRVDIASGAFEDLPSADHALSPTWDPANVGLIVYSGDLGLVNLNLNQGTAWPLTGDVADQSVTFSPDGSKLAVTYRQHDHWEIHVLNRDGSGRTRLTETPWRVIGDQRLTGEEPRLWDNMAPAWSPNGAHVAFLTDRTESGRLEIWVMEFDGSNQRPLFPAGSLDGLDVSYDSLEAPNLSWQ